MSFTYAGTQQIWGSVNRLGIDSSGVVKWQRNPPIPKALGIGGGFLERTSWEARALRRIATWKPGVRPPMPLLCKWSRRAKPLALVLAKTLS